MKISKIALWTVLVLVVLSLILMNLGFKITREGGGDYSNLPEKCRPTPDYTEQSWKEHLGHHSETQDCLKYFK